MPTEHCFNFVQGGAWGRLFWSTLLHADEWHLYYNMTSLLWKGLQLETSIGSVPLLCLILELWASTSALMVALYWACNKYFATLLPGLAQGYFGLCAVGFSGVLFGMKTVNNARQTGWESVAVPILGRIQMPPKVMLLPRHDLVSSNSSSTSELVPEHTSSLHVCSVSAFSLLWCMRRFLNVPTVGAVCCLARACAHPSAHAQGFLHRAPLWHRCWHVSAFLP